MFLFQAIKLRQSKSQISTSHDDVLQQMYDSLSVKVIDLKTIHNDTVSKKYLNIENEDIIQIKRVQLADGHPIVYENIFLPVKYFTKFSKAECLHSFHDIIENHFIYSDSEKLENEILIEAEERNSSIVFIVADSHK